MPLTEKGEKILHNMQEQNGAKAGEREFYASKNAGTISGVDSVPLGVGYDAERIGFKSTAAQNPVEKRMEERQKAVERGEDPYKRLNEEMREQSKDSVPLGKCYQDDVPPAVMSGDPVVSPTSTSQYSGMQEQLRTAPQPGPVEPVDSKDAPSSRFGGKVRSNTEYTAKQREELAYLEREGEGHGERAEELRRRIAVMPKDAAPLSDLDAFARLGAGGDAWSDMTGRHDFSGDDNSSMGKLPEQVGFGEIKRMGAGFNYNQGYGGDPYKK